MRKYFLMLPAVMLFAFLISAGTALAVPASPEPVILTQPDGTAFEAVQWGDEYSSGWQNASGYSIAKNDKTNTWYYAIQDDRGYLVSGDVPANLQAPQGLARELRPIKKAAKEIAKSMADKGIKEVAPSKGTLKVPILLIDFPDYSYSYSNSDINNVLFGSGATGAGNLQDYFSEVSNNQLRVTPGAGIADWVTASYTRASYGAHSGSNKDVDAAGLVVEAIQRADADIDFRQYAVNGSVPVVVVIHAGYDESNSKFGNADDIWAHNWNLTSAGYGSLTVDGVTINNYTIQSELTCNAAFNQGGYPQAIGVIAHELGHAIGLPDTYDTTYKTDGVGKWDVMAGGSWNSLNIAGDCPPHPSPIMKTYLGWQTANPLASGRAYNIGNIEDNPGEIYMAGTNPYGIDWRWKEYSGTGEYWLLENRVKTGFDSALPGSGLMIWHVDESASFLNNEVNAKDPKFLGVEEADGLDNLSDPNDRNSGDSGDPWPGAYGNTVFSDTSYPGSTYHTGEASGIEISEISVTGNNASFTYGSGGGSDVVSVDGVTLTPTYANVGAGESISLTAAVSPADATNPGVTWYSDNEAAATVTGGVVTGVAEGLAVITVTTVDGGYTAVCRVTVTAGGGAAGEPYIEIVTESGDTVTDGGSIDMEPKGKLKFTATVYDEYGEVVNKAKLKYLSDDKKICKAAKGKLTAGKTEGAAGITISDKSTGASVSFTVNVGSGSSDPGVAGTWNINEKSAVYNGTFTVALKADGSMEMDGVAAGSYTVNGSSITIIMYGNWEDGNVYTETFDGTVSGSTMSGSLSYDSGETGSWTASKT